MKTIEDKIKELNVGDTVVVYNDIFKNTKIKYGEASAQKWMLEGSQVANYLALVF